MIEAHLNAGKRYRTQDRRPFRRVARVVLLILLAVGGGDFAQAAESEWSLLLEPMYMDAYGHDQHVLTIHERDLGSTPTLDRRTPVTLDSDSGIAARFELQYTRGDWGLGLDFFWFDTSQGRPSRSAAASGPGGPISEVIFQVSDRSFTSDDPGEVLVFNVLEDTDLIAWTVDLYAIKALVKTPDSSLHLQFGLRTRISTTTITASSRYRTSADRSSMPRPTTPA